MINKEGIIYADVSYIERLRAFAVLAQRIGTGNISKLPSTTKTIFIAHFFLKAAGGELNGFEARRSIDYFANRIRQTQAHECVSYLSSVSCVKELHENIFLFAHCNCTCTETEPMAVFVCDSIGFAIRDLVQRQVYSPDSEYRFSTSFTCFAKGGREANENPGEGNSRMNFNLRGWGEFQGIFVSISQSKRRTSLRLDLEVVEVSMEQRVRCN